MHTIVGKTALIFSIIGLIGGIFVPIFGTIDNLYWGEQISGEMDWFFFIIFFILSLIGLLLGFKSKEKDYFGYYATIIGLIGLLYNGFFSFIGLGAFMETY